MFSFLRREDGLLALASSLEPYTKSISTDAGGGPSNSAQPGSMPDASGTAAPNSYPLDSTGNFASSNAAGTAAAVPPCGPPALLEAVNLLALCRPDELERLEGAIGTKKLLNTFRALRAQQFLRAAREKLEAKAAKAAEAEAAQQPVKKILPKEAGEAFLQRLAEDAEKRARNRYAKNDF